MRDKRERVRPSGGLNGSGMNGSGMKKGDRSSRHRAPLNSKLKVDSHHDPQAADLRMPGPVYNWLCVAHSIVDVLSNAAAIRASQVYPRTASVAAQRNLKHRTAEPVDLNDGEIIESGPLVRESPLNALATTGDAHIGAFHLRPLHFWTRSIGSVGKPQLLEHTIQPPPNPTPKTTLSPTFPQIPPRLRIDEHTLEPKKPYPLSEPAFLEVAPSDLSSTTASIVDGLSNSSAEIQFPDVPRSLSLPEVRQLTSSKVPSSKIGRLFHYGGKFFYLSSTHHGPDVAIGLAASLGYGAASEILRRSVSGEESLQNSGSLMLTESNVKRLVTKLTKMRGAALKLGQFMSIQGSRTRASLGRRLTRISRYTPFATRCRGHLSESAGQRALYA
jgi:aarF domain-containing kinase